MKNASEKYHFQKGKKLYWWWFYSFKENLDNTKGDYVELKSIDDILAFWESPKQDNEEALSVSNDNDFQIHYKRLPNDFLSKIFFMDLWPRKKA